MRLRTAVGGALALPMLAFAMWSAAPLLLEYAIVIGSIAATCVALAAASGAWRWLLARVRTAR